MRRLAVILFVAGAALAAGGCGDDLAELYEANGAMEDSLWTELETAGVPVGGVDCVRPDDQRFSCRVFAPLRDGVALVGTYEITSGTDAYDDYFEWTGRRKSGDERFPRRLTGWQ